LTQKFRGIFIFFAMSPSSKFKIATKHGDCHVSGNPVKLIVNYLTNIFILYINCN